MPLTNYDLKNVLNELVNNHFNNLPRTNSIAVKFGRKTKRKLGSIWYDDKNKLSIITINGYLKNPNIPVMLLKAVLAHELVHYFTGFGSAKEKLYEYAHRGSVIKKEMSKYGLEDLYIQSEKWIKENWQSVIRKNSRYIKKTKKEKKVITLHNRLMNIRLQLRWD